MKNKLLITLFVTSLFSCHQQKINLVLGEIINTKESSFIDELEKEFNCEYNDEFMSSRFYIKSFYSLLEKDALNLSTNNSIVSLLEKTDNIILNIGNYELIRLINYTEIDLVYDQEVVKTSLEMFDYYLHNSLDILSSYTNNIIVIPLYNSLLLEESIKQNYNQLIDSYNQVIEDNCREFNIKYVNIDKLSYFVYKDNYISNKGLTYLFKQIRNVYGSS